MKIAFTANDVGGSGAGTGGKLLSEASFANLIWSITGGNLSESGAELTGTGLTLTVAAGRHIVAGLMVENDSQSVTVPDNASRWIRLQLTRDGLGFCTGYTITPQAAAATGRDQYDIARVVTNAGNSAITDARVFAGGSQIVSLEPTFYTASVDVGTVGRSTIANVVGAGEIWLMEVRGYPFQGRWEIEIDGRPPVNFALRDAQRRVAGTDGMVVTSLKIPFKVSAGVFWNQTSSESGILDMQSWIGRRV